MISIVLSVFIKFCISINLYLVNLQSMETYPTCLRQTGLSFGTIVGSSFGILGPYIVYLVNHVLNRNLNSMIKFLNFQGANFDARYPFFILGKPIMNQGFLNEINFQFSAGMTLAGTFSALFLPETLHQSLPNTIQEAENFGRNQSFWQLPKKLRTDQKSISMYSYLLLSLNGQSPINLFLSSFSTIANLINYLCIVKKRQRFPKLCTLQFND